MYISGMIRGKITALAAAAALLAAGCGQSARTTAPHPTPHATAAAATASPALSGLELRSALAQCSAQIEVSTANGHDYSGDAPHSADLPRSCRALDLGQLATAVKRALRDMLNSGG